MGRPESCCDYWPLNAVVCPDAYEAIPEWRDEEAALPLIRPLHAHSWTKVHVSEICAQALETSRAAPVAFPGWTRQDLECALIAFRMNYFIFRQPLVAAADDAAALLKDFQHIGMDLWDRLHEAFDAHLDAPSRRSARLTSEWWDATLTAMEERLSKNAHPAVSINSSPALAKPVPVFVTATSSNQTLVICKRPIVASSDRYDKDEIARHKVLEAPLPLARMPSLHELRSFHQTLVLEFPWGGSALDIIFADLIGRANLGVSVLTLPPTMVIGPPGSGKSRLVRRLADLFELPTLDLSLGGSSDSKVLAGTARGWGSAKPSDLATLMAMRCSASACVLLDELDKSLDGHREGGGIQAYLLGLLEPETAFRHMDVFLKTACDFSKVIWLSTANRLSPIQIPLRSRWRVLMLGQPAPEHFPDIAENVVVEMADRWEMQRAVLPQLSELELPLNQLTSARQVRVAVEVAVTRWAAHVRRH